MSKETAVVVDGWTLAYYSIMTSVWPDQKMELFTWRASNAAGKEKRGREKSYERAEFAARMWSCG